MTAAKPVKKTARGAAKKAVPATVVGVAPNAKPIPAEIVSDSRNKLGKRLGGFALALLLLFFVIGGYIQSAQNGRLLDRAARDRSSLIDSNNRIAFALNEQTKLVKQLQNAVRQQNVILLEKGLETIPVPGEPDARPTPKPTPEPGKTPTPGVSNPPRPSNSPQPKPEPKPSETPEPEPEPTPVLPLDEVLCSLTGICT